MVTWVYIQLGQTCKTANQSRTIMTPKYDQKRSRCFKNGPTWSLESKGRCSHIRKVSSFGTSRSLYFDEDVRTLKYKNRMGKLGLRFCTVKFYSPSTYIMIWSEKPFPFLSLSHTHTHSIVQRTHSDRLTKDKFIFYNSCCCRKKLNWCRQLLA